MRRRLEEPLLKKELRVCKSIHMNAGASKAIEKVQKIYNNQIIKVDDAHGKIVSMMRRRLEELADCIRKILGFHNGNQSVLLNSFNASTGNASILSDILNETRRLSKSIYQTHSLAAVNELNESNTNHFSCLELNEGEMSNISLTIDPNETKLPTTIFTLPVDNIVKELIEEFNGIHITDRDNGTSGQTASEILERRLEEYENLMDDLKATTKQKFEAHQELFKVKQQLGNQRSAINNYELLKDKLESAETKVRDYKEQLDKERSDALCVQTDSQNKIADVSKTLNSEIQKLKNLLHQKDREAIILLDQKKSQQYDIEDLKKQLRESEVILSKYRSTQQIADQKLQNELTNEISVLREQLEVKEQEAVSLRDKTKTEADEIEELKQRLKEAESMVAKYQTRQEMVDKKLRSELAKTHTVLKKTKAKFETCSKPSH